MTFLERLNFKTLRNGFCFNENWRVPSGWIGVNRWPRRGNWRWGRRGGLREEAGGSNSMNECRRARDRRLKSSYGGRRGRRRWKGVEQGMRWWRFLSSDSFCSRCLGGRCWRWWLGEESVSLYKLLGFWAGFCVACMGPLWSLLWLVSSVYFYFWRNIFKLVYKLKSDYKIIQIDWNMIFFVVMMMVLTINYIEKWE